MVEKVAEYEIPSPLPPYIRTVKPPKLRARVFDINNLERPDILGFDYEDYWMYRRDDYFGNWAEYVYRVPQSERGRDER